MGGSRSHTPSVEEPVQVWVLCSSPRSARNTLTESWRPSPSALLLRCPTPLLSHTMLPSQSTSWSRTPTKSWSSTTKLFTTSASEHLSSLPLLHRYVRCNLLHQIPWPAQL